MFDDWLPKAHSKQALQAMSIGQFVHAQVPICESESDLDFNNY